jgi:uncharacterized protein YndB with AHSA1/START domain
MYFLLALAVLILGVLLYASAKPDVFHVERSVLIAAPPDAIFPLINDLHRWDIWTPYNKDPGMKKSYSGSAEGVDAHYAWEGNKQVGQGEISIRETRPPHLLVFDLHMIKPFEGRNVATFALTPDGDATRVTWSLEDKHKLMLKVMTIFMNMDQMIGKDFAVGLDRLKAAVEQKGIA